jgi:hypothetical protein
MQTRLGRLLGAATVATLFCGVPTLAEALTWTLNGATFADGGTATGTFDFDAATSTLSNWNISVDGGDTGSFPPFTYAVGTATASIANLGNPTDTFLFTKISDVRELRMTPLQNLTDSGGTVPLNLHTAFGNSGEVECFNCSPFRIITAGRLSAPRPAAAPLLDMRGLTVLVMVLGAVGLASLARAGNAAHPRSTRWWDMCDVPHRSRFVSGG